MALGEGSISPRVAATAVADRPASPWQRLQLTLLRWIGRCQARPCTDVRSAATLSPPDLGGGRTGPAGDH